MSTATALSRVTGFIRMWATAYALGATGLMSAYSVANNIPNMIFELVAGGVLSSLFIPTFLELKQRDADGAWRFASHVMNLSVLALGAVALVGTLFPGPFVWTQTFRMPPGESAAVREAAEFFFRFFAIQVVIYGAGMVVQGLLNAERRYLWPALGPVFNNVIVIATMFAFVWTAQTASLSAASTVLAVGTTLGVVGMFAAMVPSLIGTGWRHRFELGATDPEVRKMLVLALPTVLYVATNMVSVSFKNASAFAVAENGPSVLMYAWTFYQLPYGILAVALATAVFTELSHATGVNDMDAFKSHFSRGLRVTVVLMLPMAAMLIALAEPLVSLYRVGAFKAEDVPVVASALRWWGAGLVFFAGAMFVLRTFYSLKDTRTPMLANMGLTVLQVALYTILTTGIFGWPGLGIDGIPIADGFFFALLFVSLLGLLQQRVGGLEMRGVVGTLLRMALSALVGGLIAWMLAAWVATLMGDARSLASATASVLAGGSVGLAASFGAARLLGVPEVSEGASRVARLLKRRER